MTRQPRTWERRMASAHQAAAGADQAARTRADLDRDIRARASEAARAQLDANGAGQNGDPQ
ncbi:hypothetical protein ACFYPC_09500 [Streptomyces sp. NPDC005808]|uniref:hypothetical protein n=1 Tax=Streptomyces sp. NPDC005808 TaxID=3364734 RepID=UPI00367CC272